MSDGPDLSPGDLAPGPLPQALPLEGGLRVAAEHRARVDELAARVDRHRASYYAGAPEISDEAYDAIEDELRALDPTHPALARVGAAALVSEWVKARHEIPMGSLNKVNTPAELREWLARCDALLAKDGHPSIAEGLFVAEKLDGISIEVVYREGRLADAITRGDGLVGERITPNVARMKGVPARIPASGSLSVRGEIILRRSDFEKHHPDGLSLRNTAAGLSKRFDGQGAEHCTVLFYEVADHVELSTEREKFSYLRSLGLATPHTAAGSIDDVLALHERYGASLRAELDYEIDGLVVYADSRSAQALLGELNRRPRGAVAYKFASPSKLSRVVRVLWDTGPSGRVTPVAIVEPVVLAGATVQRASLHNAANVRALGIGPGDEVLVSRRNDVIPYIEEVVERVGLSTEPPASCPVCASPVAFEGEYLLCRNDACTAIVEGRIHNWIDAIGALEWGDRLVEQLVEAQLVREPVDLYRLSVEDIAALETRAAPAPGAAAGEPAEAPRARRRGDKIARKALEQLQSRLPLSLHVFLAALGIEGFAQQTARLVVSSGFGTLEAVLAATEAELAAVDGLGPLKAAAILRGLGARRAEIERLLAAGIVPVSPAEGGALGGKSFCFTGAASRPRAELVRLVENHGGRVLSTVTKELEFLVIDDPGSTSSKAVKARKYGTQLITERDLEAMVGVSGADS